MKKIIFAILFSIMFVPAQAQHWFGVRGGYNVSDISIDKFNDRKTETYSSINYGVAYKGYINKYTGLQVELNYMERGFAYKDNDTTTIRQSLELPVYANLRYEMGAFFAYVNFGCYVGYLNSKKYKISDSISTRTISTDFNNRDNRFEFGVGGGLGIGVHIAKRIEVFGEFRYTYGLTYLMEPKYKTERIIYLHPTSMQGSFGLLYRLTSKPLKSKSYIKE